MATDGRLHTDARPVDDLVDDVLNGAIRIPSFQRGLKWQRSDVIRLFDSIVRGYPVGNLLLWRRPAEAMSGMRIGSLTIDAPSTDSALFVVDGQQRLTSLANALSDQGHDDPRFALAYDVEREIFVHDQKKSVVEIPLPVIFDLPRLLQYFSEHPELLSQPEFVQRANRAAKAIREFRVPVYVVEQSDEAVLRDIFDRMNNYGRKLTRAEVFSALHESGNEESGTPSSPHDLSIIASRVHAATGYGLVDENTVLLAVLARRRADISRDIRREFDMAASPAERVTSDFPTESPSDAREATVRAMTAAVVFLQDHAGAPHFAMLPYRYLLVVLTRFFGHFTDPMPGTLRNLRRWFWRAAVLGPQITKGNITYATRSMCDRVVPGEELASVEGLLEMVSVQPQVDLEVVDFKTNYAVTRIMVAAMWDLRPERLDVSSPRRPYSRDDLLLALGEQPTALEITPPIFGPSVLEKSLRSLAGNRLLIPDQQGEAAEAPRDALWRLSLELDGGAESRARECLGSHAIDDDTARLLLVGDDAAFVRQRQLNLSDALRRFIAHRAEWNYEDTPALDLLIVDEDEERDDEVVVDVDG